MEPAYLIRATAANAEDKLLCRSLSCSAVHAAFAGFSGATVGLCSRHHVVLPSAVCVAAPRQLDPAGSLYRLMRATTGQPDAQLRPD